MLLLPPGVNLWFGNLLFTENQVSSQFLRKVIWFLDGFDERIYGVNQ